MLYSNSLTFKLQKLQFVLRQLQLGAWCLGAFFQFQVHKMNFTILQPWLLVFDILIDMQILICWGCVITPVSALSMVTVARAGCLRDSPPRVFGATSPRGSGSEAIKLWWEGRERIRSGQHFSLWSHEAGFSSWRARSAAISCRSPPQLWSGDKKYASSASSHEYILFDGLAPRLSHVSHVIAEPEPEPRYGHANYGPGEGYSGPGRGDLMSSMGSHWLCVYDIGVNGHNHYKQSCARWHWDLMRVPTQTCRSCTFRQRQSVKRYFSKNIKFCFKVCHFRSAHSQGPVSARGSHTHSARCLSWPERSGRPWRTTGWWRTPATSRPPGARRWGSWPARVTTHNVITDRSRPGTRGPTVLSWTWCRASCLTCQGWRKTRSMSYQVQSSVKATNGWWMQYTL